MSDIPPLIKKGRILQCPRCGTTLEIRGNKLYCHYCFGYFEEAKS